MNKRLIVSVGLAAIGASAVNTASADVFSASPAGRPWSAGVSLRGFYDDNYANSSSGGQDSFGFDISPSIKLNLPLERTLITGSYQYDYNYFFSREDQGYTPDDQSHQFSLDVAHTFSERFTAGVSEEFVIAQEPEIVDPTGGFPGRANGDNIRNSGALWTRALIGSRMVASLSYNNTLVDYEEKGAVTGGATVITPFATNSVPDLLVSASRSGLLDRVDQLVAGSIGYQVNPATTVSLNYKFGAGCYTGDENIAFVIDPLTATPVYYRSDVRNTYSHIGTVSVDYTANEALKASVEGGIQYTDYYNDPADTTSVGPYVSANLTYVYLEGCSLSAGVGHSRNATDVVTPDSNGRVTQDQASTRFFVTVTHKITPMLEARLSGSSQISTFNGGNADDQTDVSYAFGLGLRYALTEHFALEGSYNFDRLSSDIPGREFDRNRFMLGVSAQY